MRAYIHDTCIEKKNNNNIVTRVILIITYVYALHMYILGIRL